MSPTATAAKPKQQNLPGVQPGSALADAIESWFKFNDTENDVQDQKREAGLEIKKILKKSNRDRVVGQHPETEKPKEFYIDEGEEKLRVPSIPTKPGQTKK